MLAGRPEELPGHLTMRCKWLVRLEALPAGGPHTMTVSGPQTAEVRDVMVGDVPLSSECGELAPVWRSVRQARG